MPVVIWRVRDCSLREGLCPGFVGRSETRYGVAIDRVTGAVAQGPFELETVTDGQDAAYSLRELYDDQGRPAGDLFPMLYGFHPAVGCRALVVVFPAAPV
ncbi:MAG: hypothetical protein ACP5R4_11040 [Armatimonadota bacterium]